MIQKIQYISVLLLLLVVVGGCHEVETFEDDTLGNFDALWQTVNDHYCFFEEKDIDWQSIKIKYRTQISPATQWPELYNICSRMLNELEDGHVNLITPFATSSYRNWWTDYPQNFNLRTIQQYYLEFQYLQTSGITYSTLGDGKVGYMYYPSFSTKIGETNLDYILAILSQTEGLIIDVRNNGGGLLTNINTLVSRFITEEFTGGYIRHKTGPEHDAFSSPYPITYKPADKRRISYIGKPVIVLTNRSCFSAANNFVAVMKELPQVKIVGARTGGGGGLPFSAEIPNGWGIRFSACPITDCHGNSVEKGVDPSMGCEVQADEEELAAGKDAILEFALKMLGVEEEEPPTEGSAE